MANRYHKVFLSLPPEFEQLSYDAKAFFFYIRGHYVEADGTIAVVKHGEKIYRAVARTYAATTARGRRRFDKIVTEQYASGFLALHYDRVAIPYWREQQSWRKGPPPPVRCEPDLATLTRLAHESSTRLLEHFSNTSLTLLDDFSDASLTLPDDSLSVTLWNHSTSNGQSGNQPVGSASIGSAPPATGNLKARGEEGCSPAGGSPRAGAVDDAPTPEEAEEAAGIFDKPVGVLF